MCFDYLYCLKRQHTTPKETLCIWQQCILLRWLAINKRKMTHFPSIAFSRFLTSRWLVSLHSITFTTYVTLISVSEAPKVTLLKSHFLSSHLLVVKKGLETNQDERKTCLMYSYFYSVSAYLWHIIHSHREMHSISVSTKVSTWQAVLSLLLRTPCYQYILK